MCVYALLSLTVLCCAGSIHTWLTSATTDKPGKGLAAHCYVLLDRSGSMSQMQSAVIEGFGSFVREQAAKEGAMRLTLAQFDSTDPFEILIDGVDIHEVPALDFKPRNTTPLYDAMAKMIAHIERMSSDRADEDVTVVVFTDGGENASREFSSATVFGLVEQKKKLGWTFVFLGANQDSYKSGGAVGFSRGSTTNFQASAAGAKAAWGDITAAYSHRRARIASRSVAFRDASPAARAAQVAEAADFFRATPRAAEAQMASK